MGGIAIIGLNGSGKSTLTHALSQKINYYAIDVEDYYFPEQMSSRKAALDNNYNVHCDYLGNIPYSVARSKTEVQELLYREIHTHHDFIFCEVIMNWSEELNSYFDIAFVLQAPLEKRVERVQNREQKRFGDRVNYGGDMYNQQANFLRKIKQKEEKDVIDSAQRLQCKVVILDGNKPIEENVSIIMKEINYAK